MAEHRRGCCSEHDLDAIGQELARLNADVIRLTAERDGEAQMPRKSANALVDDPDWCGHAFVSRQSWTCADCDRPVTAATRLRLEAAPTLAPPGAVWALQREDQDAMDDDLVGGWLLGVFTNRARIAAIFVRESWLDADDVRDILRRTHWYQGVFNTTLFEGWEEGPDEEGKEHAYKLALEWIDRP